MARQKERVKLEIISKETLNDGRIRYTFNTGAISIIPPLPGKEWQERVSCDMSRISYDIIRRIEAEKQAPHLPCKSSAHRDIREKHNEVW